MTSSLTLWSNSCMQFSSPLKSSITVYGQRKLDAIFRSSARPYFKKIGCIRESSPNQHRFSPQIFQQPASRGCQKQKRLLKTGAPMEKLRWHQRTKRYLSIKSTNMGVVWFRRVLRRKQAPPATLVEIHWLRRRQPRWNRFAGDRRKCSGLQTPKYVVPDSRWCLCCQRKWNHPLRGSSPRTRLATGSEFCESSCILNWQCRPHLTVERSVKSLVVERTFDSTTFA